MLWEYKSFRYIKSGTARWDDNYYNKACPDDFMTAILNEQGQQGWELVSMWSNSETSFRFVFKRPKPLELKKE